MASSLVSVIIPAHNAEPYVGAALRSACRQTHRQIEVLVVDDGSTDKTAAIVEAAARRDARVRLFRQRNLGVAAARNRAIRHARGAFIAPLDADDVWHPEKLRLQVERMQQTGPRTGLVYSWWMVMDPAGRVCIPSTAPSIEGRVCDALLRRNFLGNASIPLFRRACLDEVGLYNTRMRERGGQGCEDWDLALRVAERYDVRLVRRRLVYYRKVASSMSMDSDAMVRSHQVLVEEARGRNAAISPALLRRARSGFQRYIARTAFVDGRHAAALRWSWHSTRLDPQAMLSGPSLFVFLASLFLAGVGPLASSLWPGRTTWLRLRRSLLRLRRRPAPAEEAGPPVVRDPLPSRLSSS
jgi:glycosyltransferase involved in cell wall biosynthesis